MLETHKAQDTSKVTIPEDTTIGNQQVRDVAYIAGLMDGEGTFCLEKNSKLKTIRYTPRVSMGITNQAVAEKFKWFIDNYGMSCYSGIRKYEEPFKPIYTFEIKRFLMVKRFIELVLPYLVGKKRQAEILLMFINSRLDSDGNVSYRGNSKLGFSYAPFIDGIWLECRMLNGGGRRPRAERDPNSKRMQQLSNLNDCTSSCKEFTYIPANDTVSSSTRMEASKEGLNEEFN